MIARKSGSAILPVMFIVAGCSSIPAPPEAIALDIRPLGDEYLTLEALSRPGGPDMRLPAPHPPSLPLPLPRIEWWPERPR